MPEAVGSSDRAGAVFAALADATRRDILRRVTARSDAGTTATELSEDVPVSRQAIVKHLGILADAGLVAAERHGREQRYRLTPDPLHEAVRWLVESGAAWDTRLDRLRAAVDGTPRSGRR